MLCDNAAQRVKYARAIDTTTPKATESTLPTRLLHACYTLPTRFLHASYTLPTRFLHASYTLPVYFHDSHSRQASSTCLPRKLSSSVP